jgi:hypothetical protein
MVGIIAALAAFDHRAGRGNHLWRRADIETDKVEIAAFGQVGVLHVDDDQRRCIARNAQGFWARWNFYGLIRGVGHRDAPLLHCRRGQFRRYLVAVSGADHGQADRQCRRPDATVS